MRKATTGREAEGAIRLPALVFVSRRQDGASRRMESLVAWVKVTQKKHLQVIEVDADRQPSLARSLAVRRIPALVVVKDRRVVGRIEGRATGRQIDELIRPHLAWDLLVWLHVDTDNPAEESELRWAFLPGPRDP